MCCLTCRSRCDKQTRIFLSCLVNSKMLMKFENENLELIMNFLTVSKLAIAVYRKEYRSYLSEWYHTWWELAIHRKMTYDMGLCTGFFICFDYVNISLSDTQLRSGSSRFLAKDFSSTCYIKFILAEDVKFVTQHLYLSFNLHTAF